MNGKQNSPALAASLALDRGDLTAAEGILRDRLRVAPLDADALNVYGALAQRLERYQLALDLFDRAARARRNWADPIFNAAYLLDSLEEHAQAHQAVARALAIDPTFEPALNLYAATCRSKGRLQESLRWQFRLIAFGPSHARAFANLGIALEDIEQSALADLAIRQALAMAPADAGIWGLYGGLARERGADDSALVRVRRAQRLDPNRAEAFFTEAMIRLYNGDYDGGWAYWEKRLMAARNRWKSGAHAAPTWQGEPLNGRTIMLWHEQGHGDNIQFLRFVADLKALGATVYLSLPKALRPLVTNLPVTLVDSDADIAVDYQASLISLGAHFARQADASLWPGPYLSAPADRKARWRARIGGGGLRIGLVWAGSKSFRLDHFRSPGLANFAPVFDVAGIQWFGLQVGDGREALAEVRLPPGFQDLGPEIADFADTAAIMDNLDLVISSCTGPAHLAGALGRPVWILVPAIADWRWMKDRTDTPWYPTARLFRQTTRGDWATPVAALAQALAAWVNQPAGR